MRLSLPVAKKQNRKGKTPAAYRISAASVESLLSVAPFMPLIKYQLIFG